MVVINKFQIYFGSIFNIFFWWLFSFLDSLCLRLNLYTIVYSTFLGAQNNINKKTQPRHTNFEMFPYLIF